MWRVSYSVNTILRFLRHEPVDIGVYAFFVLPGRMRESVFGGYFLVGRFLRKFNLGTIVREGDRIKLTVADLVFFLPTRGFEQGDFFDIVVPYLEMRRPESKDAIRQYMKTNLERFLDGPYVNEFCSIGKGDTVIDAGANIGLFSVVAAKLAGDRGSVHAFEPIAEAAELLRENIAINRLANVSAYPFALGEENGDIELSVNMRAHFEGSSRYLERGGERRKVKQVTLDSFVREQGLAKVHFIKADVEGAERDLLQGAEGVIRRQKPKIALRIYHRKDDPEILEAKVRSYVQEYEMRKSDSKTLWAKMR